ncbi:glycosyltransferase family 2 protein [Rufibacter psychrotolerans]|uniref:glycosyltransferase family 2 protein n=1 Tax=Rufibacter psychrotolerans TaxID=2812556 RepID=UPI0019688E7D|nr:glycosyltransferase [Rufibacter sp. SYSU D00308]
MESARYNFQDVTLLITHYNRSTSLARLLKSFQELGCSFEQVIVSDDGSRPEHLEVLKQLQKAFSFQLLTSPSNKGLGHNINKGQDAVKTPYTLYIQEDFIPKPAFLTHFQEALDIMSRHDDVDLIRFYAYFKYPYLKPHGKGFSEMLYKPLPWYTNHLKFYSYSDHPHLRRSTFCQKFGRYKEGRRGDKVEFDMCLSFIKNKGKGLFFENFTGMFEQKNSPDEPSTMDRPQWKQQKEPPILLLRWLYLKYRLLKHTLELMFTARQTQGKKRASEKSLQKSLVAKTVVQQELI